MTSARVLLPLCLAICAAHGASAQTKGRVAVNAADNIYGAGQASAPGGGIVPTAIIPIGSGAQCLILHKVKGTLTTGCASAAGCITLNDGRNLNDADGVGGQQTKTSNTGTSLISGIKAPNEGYLVSVFLPAGGPSGPAPASLDFDTGMHTRFRTLSPILDQTFFVGDGRREDGMGARQKFVVPAGAASVVLGISDTCMNGNGAPGCYNDNKGSFFVFYELSTTACD